MGGEALEQQLAQPGLVAPQGVEPIGGGRCLGEAAQQLPPELLLSWGIAWSIAKGCRCQGIALEHQGRQGIPAPALAP